MAEWGSGTRTRWRLCGLPRALPADLAGGPASPQELAQRLASEEGMGLTVDRAGS